MTTAIIRKKGQFTLPVEIREEMGIEEDDVVTVTSIGKKAILIFPKKSKTLEIIKESSALAKKRGITLEEMLAELDEIRHKS